MSSSLPLKMEMARNLLKLKKNEGVDATTELVLPHWSGDDARRNSCLHNVSYGGDVRLRHRDFDVYADASTS